MTQPVTPTLPDISSPLTTPFWHAARNHRFVMQRCPGCGALRWPPKPLCPTCWRPATGNDWTDILDTGYIWSFIVYHRAFQPAFTDKIPYNVAYIKLDAGPMFISNIVGTNDLIVGQRVRDYYDDATPEITFVKFQLHQISDSG